MPKGCKKVPWLASILHKTAWAAVACPSSTYMFLITHEFVPCLFFSKPLPMDCDVRYSMFHMSVWKSLYGAREGFAAYHNTQLSWTCSQRCVTHKRSFLQLGFFSTHPSSHWRKLDRRGRASLLFRVDLVRVDLHSWHNALCLLSRSTFFFIKSRLIRFQQC